VQQDERFWSCPENEITTEQQLSQLLSAKRLPDKIYLADHLWGFDSNYSNIFFDSINARAIQEGVCPTVVYPNFLPSHIKTKYSNLNTKYVLNLFHKNCISQFLGYRNPPQIDYQNFICSFNGVGHVSRQFLTAALAQRGYFNPATVSKNFSFTANTIDGNLQHHAGNQERLLRKFFFFDGCEEFFEKQYSFGHVQFDHGNNVKNLSGILTSSFVHVVSETLATGYIPFVTEKLLYSVSTRGLFVAYGQPGWHTLVEEYWGFKNFHKIFDYSFDTIKNPVERLVTLITMLSKFEGLSQADWYDLYDLEKDTIEFNYDHLYSGKFWNRLLSMEESL